MNKGAAGTISLNTALQGLLNPSKEEVLRGARSFRQGDKVMQVRNNYEKEVFNGDIGRIVRIDPDEHEVVVSYDGREVSYDFSELEEIALAYAISIHKSQGSEYPAVVIPLLTQHYVLLQRNLLYTAVTRARRLVVLVGSRRALATAVRNGRTDRRFTGLKGRLAAGIKHSL
jgi:exodeoxyribonuclease V alpha subunit